MDFNQICKAIKEVKIQGARNVAIAALKAYSLNPTKDSIKNLISLRPTEPALQNALRFAQLYSVKAALLHFSHSEKKIFENSKKLFKNKKVVYTHCHSSTVTGVVINNKNKIKKVNCTETRPLFQGRKTAVELSKANVPVTLYVDSAMRLALKDADIALLGADSILKDGNVINKIGSELVAETAFYNFRTPLYICTNSWKFDPRSLYDKETKIEFRSSKEVWDSKPKNINILNPAFEKINHKLIRGIVCEFGILTPEQFVKKAIKTYPWMK